MIQKPTTITHVVKCFTANQNFAFHAHSLTEAHQLLQACRQMSANKILCIRWKVNQWILQSLQKLEKLEKNSENDGKEEYEKYSDPDAVFTPQLLESILPTHGLRGKIQIFSLRWRYSFTQCLLTACLLLPKHIYEYCRYKKQLKR